MAKPMLKQYSELMIADLENHPVWMCVHGIDETEPWYGETDELTYRPWTGVLPYPCSRQFGCTVVARTQFRLADGTLLTGLSVPPFPPDRRTRELWYRQPEMFLPDGTRAMFWFGGGTPTTEQKHRVYELLERTPNEVFPMAYSLSPEIADDSGTGMVPGFVRFAEDRKTVRTELD